MLAEARLFQKIGDDARKWRFEARPLPETDTDGEQGKEENADENRTYYSVS